MAAFMTRMRNEDEPCRLKGMTFHSNLPSWERKLACHQSASESRSRT